MCNKLIEEMEKSCENHTIVQLYLQPDDFDVFNLGILISIGKMNYVLLSIDKHGRADGIRIGFNDDIYKITIKSKYIDKYKFILSQYKREIEIDEYLEYWSKNDCNITSFLEYAFNNKKVITLSLCNSNKYDSSGFIDLLDAKTITLRILDSYGDFDELSIIRIEDIDFVSCDSEDERILELLSNK